MAERCWLLSTCGTSLLTNHGDDAARRLVTRHANKRTSAEVDAPDRTTLQELIERVRVWIPNAALAEVAAKSAELNTITKFYGGRPPAGGDYHVLVCTDTWLGQATADLVKSWLQQQGCGVEVLRQKDLRTDSLAAFQLALSELVAWCDQAIPPWQGQGYRIVFNLTGGFKSVQGFMQSLAMFYADEVVYIFESQTELLRIPRLPVRMAPIDAMRDSLTTFRRLALQLPVDPAGLSAIPGTLLLHLDSEVALSPWGELTWRQARRELYAEQLWPTPSARIRYGPRFERAAGALPADRVALVNGRIDDLARHLERGGTNLNSLDLKPLHGNPRPPSTHEIDAWADLSAWRIFGHSEGPVFILDTLGPKLA